MNTKYEPGEINKKLIELQRDFEKDLKAVYDMIQTKGKTAAFFNTLNNIRGKKKR